MDLLVINARLIAMPAGRTDPGYREQAWMLIREGRISDIGDGVAPDVPGVEILDAAGKFVAPGFVSAHSHLFTSASRGLGADQTLYGWCDAMFSVLGHASPDQMYWATMHGSLDFLANGVTTAYDFTDPRIPWEPMIDGKRLSGGGRLRPVEHQLRQIDAKMDAGLRFVNSTFLDELAGTDADIFGRFGDVVDYVAAADSRFALGAAISGAVQWSPRPDSAELEVTAMRRFGVVNQAHVLETRVETALQQSKFARYRDAGALGPGMIFGHFVQTTPDILRATAAAGAGMSWQPGANGRLASGIALVPEMLELGIQVGMGLDDQACTDIADPWQNMRLGMFMQRARTGDPLSMMPETVLRLQTLGSAKLLGIDDQVGSLEVGKYADFLVVDPRQPDIGPLWHPVRSYVLACGLRNLTQVYVGGVLVSEHGVSRNPLAAQASAVVHEEFPALVAEHGIVL